MHIDNLVERLKQPRVRRVLEPILTGDPNIVFEAKDPDLQYCMDLGLVAYNDEFTVANSIYREVLIRALNLGFQQSMPKPEFRGQRPTGELDMQALMVAFMDFWREHSEIWDGKSDYTEFMDRD